MNRKQSKSRRRRDVERKKTQSRQPQSAQLSKTFDLLALGYPIVSAAYANAELALAEQRSQREVVRMLGPESAAARAELRRVFPQRPDPPEPFVREWFTQRARLFALMRTRHPEHPLARRERENEAAIAADFAREVDRWARDFAVPVDDFRTSPRFAEHRAVLQELAEWRVSEGNHRRDLDLVWDYLVDAECRPRRELSESDRRLVASVWRLVANLISSAACFEGAHVGDADQIRQQLTEHVRPTTSEEASRRPELLFTTAELPLFAGKLFKKAKKIRTAWRRKPEAERRIGAALLLDIERAALVLLGPVSDADRDFVLKQWRHLCAGDVMPSDAGKEVARHLLHVSKDAVREGARDRLRQLGMEPRDVVEDIEASLALDLLDRKL